MINLPDELRPSNSLLVTLPSGDKKHLQCCRPTFEKWPERLRFGFGRKPAATYRKKPIFPELLILRLLQAHGWKGVWVSSYGGIKYLQHMPLDWSLANARVSLPDCREHLLKQIRQRSGQRGGCFDVYAWRDKQILFCEAKQHGKDRIRSSQRRWIEAATLEGVALDSLLIVEWTFGAMTV
jgi:hypothetical protein